MFSGFKYTLLPQDCEKNSLSISPVGFVTFFTISYACSNFSSVSFCSVCAFSAIFLSFFPVSFFYAKPCLIHIKQVIIFRNILDILIDENLHIRTHIKICEQCIHIAVRIKLLQIVNLLADTNVFDRNIEF